MAMLSLRQSTTIVIEAAHRRLSVKEFLEWQRRQDRKYELVDGVPVVTAKSDGTTDQHDRITVNAIATLGSRLRGKPCRPRTSNTLVLTSRGARRPDVSIECGKLLSPAVVAGDPLVVIEILSPSTTKYERFQKFSEFWQHSSIAVIAAVDTEQPRAIVWRRSSGAWNSAEVAGLDAVIDLPEIEASCRSPSFISTSASTPTPDTQASQRFLRL